MGNVLGPRPNITYRRGKSLKDRMCTNISKQSLPIFKACKGFYPCGKCKACKNSTKVKHYTNKLNGSVTEISKCLNCFSDFTVYILICPCDLQYVGSTKNPVKKRILEHKRAITNNDPQYPVARHFSTHHKSNSNLVKFFAVDRVEPLSRGGDRLLALRKLESKYILNLNTKQPMGLNVDEEMYIHLK